MPCTNNNGELIRKKETASVHKCMCASFSSQHSALPIVYSTSIARVQHYNWPPLTLLLLRLNIELQRMPFYIIIITVHHWNIHHGTADVAQFLVVVVLLLPSSNTYHHIHTTCTSQPLKLMRPLPPILTSSAHKLPIITSVSSVCLIFCKIHHLRILVAMWSS